MLCGYKRVSSIRFGQVPQPSPGVGKKRGGEEKEEKWRKGRKKEKLDVFLDEHLTYILQNMQTK